MVQVRVEVQLQKLIDDAIAQAKDRIERQVQEAADRLLAQRLSTLGVEPPLEGDWLDRETIVAEYGVPYWQIRDAQIAGKVPSVRRGRKVLSLREDVDKLFRRAA